jgi:hypothetical protein
MSHCYRGELVFVAFCLTLAAALPLLSRGDGPPLGDKYALLVGVRRYDKTELRDLPYAEADMQALADVLKKAGYKRVVLMTQTNGADQARFLPEAARIRAALKGLLADRTESDSVLIAFAGHGVQYKGEDESYFCPMDAKLADKTTLVSLGDVYKELEKSEAGTHRSRRSIPTAVGQYPGTTVMRSHRRWGASRRIRGVCTTCTAMCGSGAPTIMMQNATKIAIKPTL